jgi:intracellular septation protein
LCPSLFSFIYKTVDPKDTHHPLLQLIGSAGGVDNNNILVATTGLIISMLIIYGGLFITQSSVWKNSNGLCCL